jgi:iron complex outermembrane receptor protein
MKTRLLLVIGIALMLQSHAQFTLQGTVRNQDSRLPLYGAHISIENTLLSVVSGPKGEFRFTNLRKGTYTLNISYMGFGSRHLPVQLDKNISIEIELQPAPILQNEIIISSTRAGSKLPVTFEDISNSKIKSANQGKDLPLILSESMSAVATSDAGNGMGYTALRIRGTDMSRINVTVNGIPLNDPESHNVFWVDLPDVASSTDNIQIQRGVGTSTNGAAAFGASINLLTSSLQSDPYAEISTIAGSYNSFKISGLFGTGLIREHWSFNGRVSGMQSDGFIDRASSDLFSYHLNSSYTNPKSSLRFNLISGNEVTYQAWDGIPGFILDTNRTYNGMGAYYDATGKLRYYDKETDNYRQTHYQLLYSRQILPQLYFNAAGHYTKGKGYYEQYRESDDLADYGIMPVLLNAPFVVQQGDTLFFPDSLISQADLIRRKWLDNDFAGITYSFDWKSGPLHSSIGGSWNHYTGRHFGTVIWSEIALSALPDLEWYRSKAIKKDFNIFAKASYDLNGMISFFADLQLRTIKYGIDGIDDDSRDITQEHSFGFFNPKAGLTITINEKNSTYISYAVAHREPNRDNFVDADPNRPGPTPETLFDLEFGHKYQGEKLSLGSNIYWMNYRDQLVLTGAINDVGAAVMVNIPESYRLGFEFNSKLQAGKLLSWEVTATLSQNKIKRFTEYVDNWDSWGQESIVHKNTNLAFSPALIAGSNIHITPINHLSINLITKYVGRQYLDNTQDNSRMLAPYLLNDLRFSLAFHPRFVKEVMLNIFINNLFNRQYESNAWVYRYVLDGEYRKLDGYYAQAGVNFMAGITLKF